MAEINLYFLVISSIGFDLLIGDPEFLLHPVQVIGVYVKSISTLLIDKFKNNNNILTMGGFFISISTILISFFIGKLIEFKLYQSEVYSIFVIFMFLGLSSCIASRSLISNVKEISNLIGKKYKDENSLPLIRQKVQRIVSRDVSCSDLNHLLRSATESLTENAIDGIFGPLFWIFVGAISLKNSIFLPGPLSLGFSYKAISTLDSMIGYKNGHLKYLGFFSAKIEDFATYLPSRLVAITLPLVSSKIISYKNILEKVFSDGRKYESPNAGISQAIFAYIVNIQLGGKNIYPNGITVKPKINFKGAQCSNYAIDQICSLIIRLELTWIIIFTLIFFKIK